jgi:hypothetical protein
MLDMEGILLILLVLVILCAGRNKCATHGGCNVKPKTNAKRPNVFPAPQKPIRNKYGRTKDEQELHEWLEDNPR